MKTRVRKLVVMTIVLLGINTMINSQTIKSPFDIDLWPNGAPTDNGQTSFDESKGDFKPSIKVFLPTMAKPNGRFILICPGGGYTHLAYHHEGYDWAPYFNKQGIGVAVLKYRMPKGGNTEVPISDAEEAMRVIREHAIEWGVNPQDVGIMGFSAGGHLASTIATHAPKDLRPNFQILMYPVITMDKNYTHLGSRASLLTENPSPEIEELYSNEKQVDENTPRAFIAYSNDDNVVPPLNGVNYYLALHNKNVPAALYIYPTGGHGWGISEGFLYKNQVLDELSAWLRSFEPE